MECTLIKINTKCKALFPLGISGCGSVCGSVAAKYLVSIDFNGDAPASAKMGTALFPLSISGSGSVDAKFGLN